jgi:hypothetical protein
MSVPWEVVGSVLGAVLIAVGGAAWLWFNKMRTTAKLKDLREVNVRVRNGNPFKGKCVDMVIVGARNYLKFDVEENGVARERLIPNDEIIDLHATRPTPKSPEKWLKDAASSTMKLRDIEEARRIVAHLSRRRGRSE